MEQLQLDMQKGRLEIQKQAEIRQQKTRRNSTSNQTRAKKLA